MDIRIVMESLAKRRKIFASEADFQFALAWEIQKFYPEAEIRLEYCPVDIDPAMHIDILVNLHGLAYPIELKYPTVGLDVTISGERFKVKSQDAQDLGRYEYLKDIVRIEKLDARMPSFACGYAILLSNDLNYWKVPHRIIACDAEFRIHEGVTKAGLLRWAPHTGGTQRGRESPLELKGEYAMNWVTFSQVNDSKGGTFRYICAEIKGFR